MSSGRSLPKKRNPLLAPERTPEHSELAGKRRLGQTTLAVKTGQVGTSNATKPENLGIFEYAHLRAPLPESLKGSEIFSPTPKSNNPHAYFLMRRSSDGYVSATGMFKASFPWSKISEEQAERDYIKALSTTGEDEVAGNVWIPETFALELAEEYGITPWIRALLDPSPVQVDEKKPINPPPTFTFTAGDKLKLAPPSTPARGRGRPRATSPIKATPAAKATSPRKRVTKAVKEANAAAARQATDNLQAVVDNTTPTKTGKKDHPDKVNGIISQEATSSEDKVTIAVDQSVEVNGDVETTHTKVQVQMPVGSPGLPLPESTEEMIATAKEMVQEAAKLEGGSSKVTKRKADELDTDDEEATSSAADQPAKKTKLMLQEVKKQKVRTRALVGVAVTAAIGALIPYVLGS